MKTIILPIFIISLFLTGCASLPTIEEMQIATKDFTLPKVTDKNNAVVYVVRPSSLGSLVRFNVFLDDKEDNSEMGYTRGSQYIYFTVTPGIHNVYSKAENWESLSIDAKPGSYIFIKQIPQTGVIMARNDLTLITDIEGKYHVKNIKVGTIKKEVK